MPPKVYAPNVHLFAYHLRDTDDRELLWRKSEGILKRFDPNKSLKIKEREGYRADLLEDITDDDVSLHFQGEVYLDGDRLDITGLACPIRIHDTYSLALNLRRPELDAQHEKTAPVDLRFLPLLNPSGCLMPDEIGSFLGQTLLLTVWHTEGKKWFWKSSPNKKALKTLADECLRAFIPNNTPIPTFNQQGELFNSPIFEYGIPSRTSDYCHILIWIFCETETDTKFGTVYNNFINLFCDRNKIIKAYQLSRQIYQVVSQNYQNIEPYIDKIFNQMPLDKNLSEADLKQFKEYLKDIPQKYLEYSRLIRDLDHYRLTIEINAQNYQRELREIHSQLPGDELSFLEAFFKEDCRLFQEQIQADLGYFRHGVDVLEKALTAIQGRVDIEQAELLQANEIAEKRRDRHQAKLLQANEIVEKTRDRHLQTTIAVVAVGLGAAGVAATASPYIIAQTPQQKILPPFASNSLHPLSLSLLFSLGFGVGGAIAAAGMTLLIQKHGGAIASGIIKLIPGRKNQAAIQPENQEKL